VPILSEEEEIAYNPQAKLSHIKVTVDKSKAEEDLRQQLEAEKEARKEAEETIEALAEKAFFEEKDKLKNQVDAKLYEVIDNIESPSELEKFSSMYEALKGSPTSHKTPTGTATLPNQNNKSLRFREYTNSQDALADVYKHARDPDSPYYAEAKKIQKELWSKVSGSERAGSVTFDFMPKESYVSGLPKNFTWMEYTEWYREKMDEIARRRKQ